MRIEQIHILQFAGLSEKELTFGPGINILEGRNESGKSTVCRFIKFMFYGVADKDEKKLLFGWNGAAKPVAAGTMTVSVGNKRYRIERNQTATGKGSCKVIDLDTNSAVMEGKKPGEVWFGVDSEVFEHTAFVGQTEGSRVDGRAVSEGIENILFSADEDVNTQKALKKLDDARIVLLYKHQHGGKIHEAQKELEELEERFARAVTVNKNIIIKEGAVRDATEKIAAGAAKMEQLGEMIDYYDTGVLKRQYEELMRLREELDAAEVAASALDQTYRYEGFLPDDGDCREVLDAAAMLNDSKSRLEQIRADTQRTREEYESGSGFAEVLTEESKDSVLTEAAANRTKSRSLFFMGVIFLVLALCCGVATALFYTMKMGNIWLIALAGCGILAFLGIVMLVAGGKSRKKNRAILDRFGVKRPEELERALDERMKAENIHRSAMALLDDLGEKEKNCESEISLLAEALQVKLSRWGKSSMEEWRDTYRAYLSDKKELTTAKDLLMRAESTAAAALRGEDLAALPTRFAAMPTVIPGGYTTLEQMPIEELRRKLDFLTKQQKALSERKHEDEKLLAGYYATVQQPSAIHDRIARVKAELAEMQKRHGAYLLAYQALEAASGRMKENVAPRLSEYAGSMMEALSEEKYTTLGIGKDLNMEFTADHMTQDALFMSAGTKDIAYISLRLALIKLLYRKELPPLVFDESFARLDDGRLRAMFAMQQKAAEEEGMQMIVSTCQTREARILRESGRGEHILLGQ